MLRTDGNFSMTPLTETQWILLGLTILVFMSASLRVLGGEAERMLQVHFLLRKAMILRNRYANQLLSIHARKSPSQDTSQQQTPDTQLETTAIQDPEATATPENRAA